MLAKNGASQVATGTEDSRQKAGITKKKETASPAIERDGASD